MVWVRPVVVSIAFADAWKFRCAVIRLTHQLFGDVDIRAFQRTRQDVTEAFGTRLADLRRTGNGCFRVGRVTDLLQTVLVVEVRDNNLSKRVVLTVGVVGANGSRGVDLDTVQSAGGETVLLNSQNREGLGKLGRGREIDIQRDREALFLLLVMHRVLRAYELTGLVEGQFALVDIERVVALDHILQRVRHHLAIRVDIERHAVGIGGLDQIVDFRNRADTKRDIVKAETRRALHLDGQIGTGGAGGEGEAVGLAAVSNCHTADRITGGRIDDLVDAGLQRFSKRSANIGGGGHLDDTADAVHRDVKDIVTVLCRQFEDIGEWLIRTGANGLCRGGLETGAS